MTQAVKKPVEPPQTYTYDDLIKLESRDIYNSVGKMYLSTHVTAPQYSMGTQDRYKWAKLFQSKEMSKIEQYGAASPGPKYNTRGADNLTYTQHNSNRFSREPRHSLGSAKFDYYGRVDIDFEPHLADNLRRSNPPSARIGLQNRFPVEKKSKLTPGPQYNPGHNQKQLNAPKFSIGLKRDVPGESALATIGCTPVIVGPGCYIQGDVPNTSLIENTPKWSISKGPRFAPFNALDKNQTYDTKSVSVGQQIVSKRKTQPAYSIGRQDRDAPQGYFKDLMVKAPQRLQIQLPQKY